MKYRDVARKLTRLDCDEIPRRSGGSHRKWLNPAAGRATVVPDWGSADLKLGTVKAAVRQLGIANAPAHSALLCVFYAFLRPREWTVNRSTHPNIRTSTDCKAAGI